MRRSLGDAAYTIIEVLIFMLVSGMLFFAVTVTISGQQGKAQFTEAVRDFDSRMQDLVNDVGTGVYAGVSNFSCSSTPTTNVSIVGGAKERGTNTGCILAGQVLQFDVGTSTYRYYTLAGKQRARVGTEDKEVATLGQANPRPVTFTVSDETTPYNLIIGRVKYNNGGADINAGGLAITTSFVGYSPGNELETGDTHVNLVPLVDASTGALSGLDETSWNTIDALKNPINGVTICLQEGTGANGRHADVRIGGSGRTSSTDLTLIPGVCP